MEQATQEVTKKRIIFDCDLTMGLPNCDIDDGLALLYVLGYAQENPNSIAIEGICTSYGNNEQEAVYANTKQVCANLNLEVPIYKGAHDRSHPNCEAANFLVEIANAYPSQISLCVTGATTNLKGAMALDPQVLSKFREVVFMGGITQSLVFNGKIMDELNFSCDPEATYLCLAAANDGAKITVMTANNCLPAHFMPSEFSARLTTDDVDGGYLYRSCHLWFDTMKRCYDLEGFCCWDVLASAYIVEPQLFIDTSRDLLLSQTLLNVGFMQPPIFGAPATRINTPQIADPQIFCERAYRLWRLAII